MRHVRCCLFVILAVWGAFSTGCSRDEPAQWLTMPLDQTGLVEPLPEFRSMAALIESGSSTWFVKIAAPVGIVNEVAGPVKELIETIEFDQADEPKLVLPENWWTSRTHPDRFMTVMIPMQSGDPAQVAISRLSGSQDLLMNVNRWRRQISLAPAESLEGQLEPVKSPAGEWKLFDQVGLWNPEAPMGGAGPAAGATGPPAGKPEIETQPAIAGAVPTPKDFTRDPDSAFVVASFRRETSDGKVRLSVSELPAELNSWETSVASWVSESEITGLDQTAVEKRASDMKVGGFPAQKLDLLVEDSESAKAVIGVRIVCGDQAVYVKLSGDRKAVQANAAAVELVCESLKLQGLSNREVQANDNGSSDKKDQ